MGDIGGIDIGTLIGTSLGFTFGPMEAAASAFGWSKAENAVKDEINKKPGITPPPPPQPDYSDADMVTSNNNKIVVDAQITSQEFQMQQSSMDRELQHTANLELSLDNFNTKLQTSKLEYFQQMTAESNRHVEKMAADGSLPPPNVEV